MNGAARPGTPGKNPVAESLSALMRRHYASLHAARKEGKLVVWAAICVPVELFAGFNTVVVAIPENHAAMSAAKGAGVRLAEQAEALGFSMDLCSYARIDIGTELGDPSASPSGGLPRPDLLVSDTNNCSLLVKWFDVYHRAWGVPHVTIDVPFCYVPQEARDRDYIVAQFHDLIALLERMTGETFDPSQVVRALRESSETLRAWKAFLSRAATRPSPVTAFDTFAHMAPYVVLRGDPDVTRHVQALANEADRRIRDGDVPVPAERYRLLWDNIAPWHQLRAMRDRLASLGANVVHATYTSCMGTIEGGFDHFPYDGGDPLRFLARIQNFSVCPYGLELRFQAMARIVKAIGIDGIIFASNRSCKVYSIMQLDLQRRVTAELGIPSVMIDVDHADVRKYDEGGVFSRLEALLELVDAARGRETPVT